MTSNIPSRSPYVSALDAVMEMASSIRMCVITTTSFDSNTIEIAAYLSGDKRPSMWSNSFVNFELSAAKLLKRYRPEIYEDLKPILSFRRNP